MGLNVLVVDDSIELREFVAVLLEDAGYTVEQAADGAEAFERARQRRPDLILLDVIMPRMDGLELLRKLRSDLAPPVPPVILCSGFELTEAEALRRGALRFLPKPVEPADLLDAVAEALAGHAPTFAAIRAERLRAAAARRSAREDASALIARIESHLGSTDALGEFSVEHVEHLAAYLGVEAGVMAVVRGDRLTVVAASDGATRAGADLGQRVPAGNEIVETGTSLVLADAAAHPSFGAMAALGIRFFLGVPLQAPSGVPVGVLCVYDRAPREVEAEDLATLQLFGRGSSTLLALLARGQSTGLPGRFGGGVWLREVFEHVLDDELRLYERQGGSLVLAAATVDDVAPVHDVLAAAGSRERLMCGIVADGLVVFCKRAPDQSAGECLHEVLQQLRARTPVHSAGLVDVGPGGLRLLSAPQVVRLAELALARAQQSDAGLLTVRVQTECAAFE
jgi:twitching motility two-component system response regulator PilH